MAAAPVLQEATVSDSTEAARRELVAKINTSPIPEGPRWTTDELTRDFEVLGFMAPFVMVRRKADGVRGTLAFTHSPRVYFDFLAER